MCNEKLIGKKKKIKKRRSYILNSKMKVVDGDALTQLK
jgi:hypothetical protein